MDYPKPAGCDIMTMLLLDVEDRATERSDSSAHPRESVGDSHQLTHFSIPLSTLNIRESA